MNRCQQFSHSRPNGAIRSKVAPWSILVLVSSLLLFGPAAAQAVDPIRIPPITAKAQPGVLRITAPPEVLLDGKPARLAPGARIRDRNNLLVVSGAVMGQDLPVRYTLDMLGLVHEVWVLTAAEVAAKTPPAPVLRPY